MTGRCICRLLAAFSLFVFSSIVFSLFFVLPELSTGQSASTERFAVRAPTVPSLLSSSPAAMERSPSNVELTKHSLSQGTLAFQHLVRSAGIIFSGRVTSIGGDASSFAHPRSPTVTFNVERALRGTSPGKSLTIHEWAGFWQNGERYHVGEHVLLFLYSPGKLGLTSPVAGPMGRFAMSVEGRIEMSPQQRQFFATDRVLGGKRIVPYADFASALRSFSILEE